MTLLLSHQGLIKDPSSSAHCFPTMYIAKVYGELNHNNISFCRSGAEGEIKEWGNLGLLSRTKPDQDQNLIFVAVV